MAIAELWSERPDKTSGEIIITCHCDNQSQRTDEKNSQ